MYKKIDIAIKTRSSRKGKDWVVIVVFRSARMVHSSVKKTKSFIYNPPLNNINDKGTLLLFALALAHVLSSSIRIILLCSALNSDKNVIASGKITSFRNVSCFLCLIVVCILVTISVAT